jgi:sigma-B regulation protein RsbU (phosphoserine phosphatase)
MPLASLTQQSFFKHVPLETVEALLAACPRRSLAPGETIITPGEENHSLYILLSGKMEVRLDNPGTPVSFPILPGECIGEMSIIENRLTSAWVGAAEASELIVVPEADFWERVVPDPAMMRNLLQILTIRMRRSNQVVMEAREQQLRFEALQKELETAGKIQANSLPDARVLNQQYPQVDLFALMSPAKEVGGDFYDLFALDGERFCLAIGDVSGKGMPAALFMVRVMTLLRMSVQAAGRLEGVLETVNRHLSENNPDLMFVTLFVAILEVPTGRLEYSVGGHNPPLLSQGGAAFGELGGAAGILLGVLPGATYPVNEIRLQPGDRLLLYTDGVTEAENPAQDLLTLGRAMEALNQAGRVQAEELAAALNAAVREFSHGASQSDDITILALCV